MILVIDNYDSFVFNLARYIRLLIDHETVIVRNDAIDGDWIESIRPAAIVVSPGPCTPKTAGESLAAINRFANSIPILGVCLGHQSIFEVFGGSTIVANQPVHGKSSRVTHNGSGMFKNIPESFLAGRYHSLTADPNTIPPCLEVTARTSDGTIMAIQHRTFPVYGVQFHPESILTEHGYQLLSNFLELAGLEPGPLPIELNETSIAENRFDRIAVRSP